MRLYSVLDERMNADIDAIIAKLEEAKKSKTYLQRARIVGEVSRSCNDFEFYWDDKLQSLMD
jgi:hypothetical protein